MSIPERYLQGSATILVSFYNKNETQRIEFLSYLQKNKFDTEIVEKDFEKYKFLWININSKSIHHGLIGCSMCEPLGNHAVTMEEFKEIFEIFKKYVNKKDLLEF